MVLVALATVVSAKLSIADDNTNANSSQQLFIDQRRLPGDAEKSNPSPPTGNADELRRCPSRFGTPRRAEVRSADRNTVAYAIPMVLFVLWPRKSQPARRRNVEQPGVGAAQNPA